ncbi:MAG TPA: histidine kinase [Terriglobia bacterium]|nr:histidine kinase [Terriglobia bacterium]
MVSDQRRQGEAILACARLALAVGCCVAVYADFVPTAPHREFTFAITLTYVLASGASLAGVRAEPYPSVGLQLAGLATDLICPTLLCLVTGGLNGAVIAIYLLAVLAAAYRWRFVETLCTAWCVVVLVWVTRAIPFGVLGRTLQLPAPRSSTSTFIGHAVCLLLLAALLGYLAEREKSFRVQALAVGRVMTRAGSAAGLQETVEQALRAIRLATGAGELRLAVRNEHAGDAHLWTMHNAEAGLGSSLQFTTLPLAEHERYFFAAPSHSWHTTPGRRVGAHQLHRCLVVDAQGSRLPDREIPLDTAYFGQQPFRSANVVNFAISDEWSGRLFALDTETVISPHAELGFLQSLVWAALPSIHQAYLLRRIRTRVRTRERKRIAGQLHDGLLQSLIALEMELSVLRRRTAPQAPGVAGELERLQRRLHEEILDARAAMEQLRIPEMSPRQMVAAMSELVARFQRDTGIQASFVCESSHIELPSFVCREIASILQEALVNVRKHSGARSVRVRFGLEDNGWKLAIADDGQGFDFSGRRSQAELDRRHLAPVMLRERARAIGAQVEIASEPGQGACVEVHAHPQEACV